MNSMWILQALSNPSLLLGIITLTTGGLGTLGIKACSQSSEINTLQQELSQTKGELRKKEVNLAVIQADLIRQENEITKYNSLANQYRRQLETKYEIPTASQQPCSYDFTLMNNLLSKQGIR